MVTQAAGLGQQPIQGSTVTKRMGSSLTKLMLAAGIGIILAAIGYLVWVFFLSPDDPAATTGGAAAALTTTQTVAGRNVILQGDAAERLVLQQEISVAPTPAPTAAPTQQPPAQNPTDTPAPPAPTTPPPTAVPPTAVPPAPGTAVGQLILVDYVVVAGDTLFSIAQRHNTSITAMADHGISRTSLQPGAVIRVPIANTATCPSGRAHVVEEGENVFRLAMRYNTTKERLAEINGLPANYLIRAGSVLCLP